MTDSKQEALMENLALNKPALQSSTCEWSRSRDPRLDAAGANNGLVSSEMGFHTDRERNPWWQVDLGRVYLVERVQIYNRRDCAERLRHFTILRSINGVDWFPCFKKRDPAVFGEADAAPFVAALEGEQIARHVRIRLDAHDCLHFSECEVFGREAPAERRMQLMKRDLETLARRDALPSGRNGWLEHVDGLSLFVDSERYAPAIIGSIRNGEYELGERSIVRRIVRPGDRVLEIGTAIGLISMVLAEIVGPNNVLTFDANPDIVADARGNFARNDMAGIDARNGVLRNRAATGWPDTVDFHISEQFWASRLDVKPEDTDIRQVLKVPSFCLEDLIAEHRANVVVCDIEGGEAALFAAADLSGIRLVVMEIHYWAVGEPAIDAIVRKLVLDGFAIDLRYSGNGMLVARRDPAGAALSNAA